MEIMDVSSLNVPISDEDADIMRMFKHRKKGTGTDDLLMVKTPNEMYLVKKSEMNRFDTFMKFMISGLNCSLGVITFVRFLCDLIKGTGMPILWLIAFEITLIPSEIKFFNSIRKGGLSWT